MRRINRRQWILSAGAGLISSASTTRNHGRAASKDYRIVDAHVHVWSSNFTRYPLAPGFESKDLWLPSFSAEKLFKKANSSGVARMNLIQMTWYGLDHSYIQDVITSDPEHFVGTGIIPAVTDVALPSPDKTMVALSKKGIYAFRIRGRSNRPPLGGGSRWMDHPGFDKMFKTGAEHNLALSFLMGPRDIPEVSRMCESFPETPVILDHLSGVHENSSPEEVTSLLQMARHKRVMIKVGAFYGKGRMPPDRPSQNSSSGPPHGIEPAVALIRDHADFLSSSDKKQILVKTAENFFFKR